MLALQKSSPGLAFVLKADRVCGNSPVSLCLYEGTGTPLLPGLRSLAGLSLGTEKLLKGREPFGSCGLGRKPTLPPPKLKEHVEVSGVILLPQVCILHTFCCWKPAVSSGESSTQQLLGWHPLCKCCGHAMQNKFILHPSAAPLPPAQFLKNFLQAAAIPHPAFSFESTGLNKWFLQMEEQETEGFNLRCELC